MLVTALVPVYLYIVWFMVPGAYASGSTHTLISDGLPDSRARSQRRAGCRRVADLFAVAAEHLGELVVVDVAEGVADPPRSWPYFGVWP